MRKESYEGEEEVRKSRSVPLDMKGLIQFFGRGIGNGYGYKYGYKIRNRNLTEVWPIWHRRTGSFVNETHAKDDEDLGGYH